MEGRYVVRIVINNRNHYASRESDWGPLRMAMRFDSRKEAEEYRQEYCWEEGTEVVQLRG